jgi:UPF0176 protein
MSNILNIAGYQFISLDSLSEMRMLFLEKCVALTVKGTILLSPEGINISLAGTEEAIAGFKAFLLADSRFAEMRFRESYSVEQPFKRMKVKLKKEIITMRRSDIHPDQRRAPAISPEDFKQWLDENRDITLLDTRNDYEMQFGTFKNALNLHLKDFSEFPEKSKELAKNKPVVMFCTGGIRCEKAAIHLMNEGFENVFQLEGGILNYFTHVGGDHYEGDCFVFDGRVALNSQLAATDAQQCCVCQMPIKSVEEHHCH